MKKRVHVFISGMVQGIFFRAGVKDKASKLGLIGFVRNLPDGRVEAVFEGEEDLIIEILEFCKKGPLGARVKDVEVKQELYEGESDSFEVLY